MKKLFLGFFLFFIFSVVFAGDRELIITGSTTVLPIAQKVAEVFMDKYPDIDISVRGGGSGVGISALIDGITDIADASRPMKKKEVEKAKSKGIYPYENIIAKDGIAVVVNTSNPIKRLTIKQIKDIYTGHITNWKELGGNDMKIIVISRDTSSGTFEAFEHLALNKARVIPEALMMASNKAVLTTVATTPGAIGYIGLGYVNNKVKALFVNGVYPTVKSVVNGSYPLSRPLFMYTSGKPKGLAKKFIDFILSKRGGKIVSEVGYVPVK